MKVLVVYYSRNGHTERLAQRLAQDLGGEAVAIEEQQPADGVWGALRNRVQSLLGREAAIRPTRRSVADCDLVLLGTPVIGGRLAAPVRTFARLWCGRLPRVAFFATSNGRDARPALDELRRLLGRAPLAELVVDAEAIGALQSARWRARVRQFVLRVKGELDAHREAA